MKTICAEINTVSNGGHTVSPGLIPESGLAYIVGEDGARGSDSEAD